MRKKPVAEAATVIEDGEVLMVDSEKLTEIWNSVKDLNNTIRGSGSNGYVGMVAQLEGMKEKLNRVEASADDIKAIREDQKTIKVLLDTINQRGCLYGQESGIHVPQPAQPVQQSQETSIDNVKYSEIRQRFFFPLLVMLVGAVLLAIPTIVQLLNK